MRVFLIITILIFNLNAKSFFSNDEQAINSIYIGALKNLLIATQETRGLSNSYMNGNVASMLLVYNSRDNMKKAIGIMESLPLAADPVINNRATTISQELIILNNKAFKLKAPAVFSAYTQQIEQILMLAQTVSKHSSKNLHNCGKSASDIMLEIMLPMTEYTGQLRGFGAGLIAKGSANKTELAKINVLIQKIQNLNKSLSKEMHKLTTKYPNKLSNNIDDKISAVKESANTYTEFAKSNFSKNLKKINPDTYFDNGTELISLIIKVYESTNNALLEGSKGWF